MNKREAIRWMLRGARLTHRHSSPDEWVTIGEDGLIELEDGVRCTPAESWSCRSGECLETGWDFVSPPMYVRVLPQGSPTVRLGMPPLLSGHA